MRKILIILCLVGCLFACRNSASNSDTPRYVILSPEVAEWVSALDGTSHIVGITAECDTPPSLRSLPQVGNFGAVSLEKVTALKPTLVLTSSLEQQALADKLNKLGIRTEVFYPHSLNELYISVSKLGTVLHQEARTRALLDSVQADIAGIGITKHPRVYVEIYNDPLMSADSTSFIGDLIEHAGGVNVFPKLARDYCQVKAEAVVAANPEIIVITSPGIHKRDVLNRKGWERISACTSGRIYTLDDVDPNLLLRAGPRVGTGVQTLHRLFNEGR
jgi:iron complex transport system substrate-binding protein